jgi:hypothetical protein
MTPTKEDTARQHEVVHGPKARRSTSETSNPSRKPALQRVLSKVVQPVNEKEQGVGSKVVEPVARNRHSGSTNG